MDFILFVVSTSILCCVGDKERGSEHLGGERQNGRRSITGGKQTRYSGDSRTKAVLLSLKVNMSIHIGTLRNAGIDTHENHHIIYKAKHYKRQKFDKSDRIGKEVGGCKCTQASQKLSDLI